MIHRPIGFNAFEFVIVSTLRARQLQLGCSPRVPAANKVVITAQHEVAEGKVAGVPRSDP